MQVLLLRPVRSESGEETDAGGELLLFFFFFCGTRPSRMILWSFGFSVCHVFAVQQPLHEELSVLRRRPQNLAAGVVRHRRDRTADPAAVRCSAGGSEDPGTRAGNLSHAIKKL